MSMCRQQHRDTPMHYLAGLLLWLAIISSSRPAHAQMFGIAADQDVVAMYLFNGQNEAGYRKQIEGRANVQIKQLAKAVELDEAAMEKLQLAAQGDICRFFRKIADVQEATKGFKLQDQEHMQKAWELIMPLQEEVSAGLFEKNSLFQRVFAASLSPDQRTIYEAYLSARKAAELDALLKLTIAEVERSIPLVSRQRKEFLRILREQPAPKGYPEGYAPYVGFAMLTRIDSPVFRAFLDEQQVKAIEQLNQQYIGYANAIDW